jgi:hypothetical protein
MDELDAIKTARNFANSKNPLFEAVEEDSRIFLSVETLDKYLKVVEVNAIVVALEKSDHKAHNAAGKLGISVDSLKSRMDKYILDLVKIPVSADYFSHSWDISIDDFLQVVERILIEIDKDSKLTNRKEGQKRKSPV